MLAPDLHQTSSALTNVFLTVAKVASYAEALQSLSDDPAVTGRGQASPNLALPHTTWSSTDWLETVCTPLVVNLPRAIATYDRKFQQVANSLIDLQTELASKENRTTSGQQKRAVTLLTDLRACLGSCEPAMKVHQDRLITVLGSIHCDAVSLQSLDLHRERDDTEKTRSSSAGQFNARLRTALDLRHQVVEDRVTAIQSIRQTFGIFRYTNRMVDRLLEDLANGAAKDVVAILDEARLPAARRVWAELSATARALAANQLNARHGIS